MSSKQNEKKAKRVSKTKNPNEPKKNKSSYMFFSVDCREEIKVENSGIDNKSIITEIGARWKTLKESNPDKVKYYEDLAEQDKKRYQDEKSSYVKPTTSATSATEVTTKTTKVSKKKETSEAKETTSKEPKKVNAYINFCTKNRESYKTTNPGALPKDITKKLSEGWRALSDSEKESYKL